MIPLDQGDDLEVAFKVTLRDPVTGDDDPVDLTLAGTLLTFTATAVGAATPTLTGANPAAGGSEITANDPATAGLNWCTLRIPDSETAALAVGVNLAFELVLEEPAGRKTTVCRGVLVVR